MNKDILTSPSSKENPVDLAQTGFQNLLEENNLLKSENSDLKISLEKALEQVRWFEEQFKLSRQRQFGQKTENVKQLELPLNIFNGEESDGAIETAQKTETITYTRKKDKKKGRNVDTSQLPRATIIYDLLHAEKTCCHCQHKLEKFD